MAKAARIAVPQPSEWGAEHLADVRETVWFTSFSSFYFPYIATVTLGWVYIGVGAAAAAGGGYLLLNSSYVTSRGGSALRRSEAKPLDPRDEPRFVNLVHGLAGDMGVTPPALWRIDKGGPNALAVTHRGPTLAITRSLLDTYTRTELEAVAAHCLVRLQEANATREYVALGPLAPRKMKLVGYDDDATAAAITRYPPALASAIRKAEPYSGRFGAFWFVSDASCHRPKNERVAALLDL